MGKRANMSSKACVSSAKAPRTDPAPAVADPYLENCQPVFKVLKAHAQADSQESSDAGTAAEMLCAALPFALKVSEGTDARHKFQDQILDAVAKELSNAVASRKEVVLSVENEAANFEAEKAAGAATQENIIACLAEKVKARDEAEEALKQKQDLLDEAKAAVMAARKKAEAADEERQAIEKTRDEFEAGLAELWSPLKGSELQGNKLWRERDRQIGKLVEKLDRIGVDQSLLAALPVALKTHVALRGEFAQATVTCAEDAYVKHLESLKDKIAAFGEEIAARAATVAQAEAAAGAAEQTVNAAFAASIAAQNAWVEETTVEIEHKSKMTFQMSAIELLEPKLADAQAELANLREVFTSFEALRPLGAALQKVSDAPEATVVEPAPEAVTEEPAEMSSTI